MRTTSLAHATWQIGRRFGSLSFALKHSPPDTSVGVLTSVDDGQLSIDVSDRGPGVAAIDRDRVFDSTAQAALARYQDRVWDSPSLASSVGLMEATWPTETILAGGSIFRMTVPIGNGRIGP